MFTDSLAWAFPRGLAVYVPFETLTSSVSLKNANFRDYCKETAIGFRAGRKSLSNNSTFPFFKRVKRTAHKKKSQAKLIALCLYCRISSFPSRLTVRLPTSVHSQGSGLPVLDARYISICRQNLLTGYCYVFLLVVSQSPSQGQYDLPVKGLHFSWNCGGAELILLRMSPVSPHWGEDFRYTPVYGTTNVYCSCHAFDH